MTDAPPPAAQPAPSDALGAGALISASIRVFRGNPIPFTLALLAPGLLGWGLQTAVAIPPSGDSFADTMWASVGGGWGIALLYSLLSTAIFILTVVPITLMTFNAAAGRPVRLTEAYAATIPIFGRAVAMSFVQGAILVAVVAILLLLGQIGLPPAVCYSLGAIALIWIYLQLVVALPVLVAGARPVAALTRSRALTAGYRRPIFGAFAGLIALIMVTSMALVAVMVVGTMALGAGVTVVMSVVLGVVSAVIYVPAYILPTLIYLRLLDLKDGGDPSGIAEVFA